MANTIFVNVVVKRVAIINCGCKMTNLFDHELKGIMEERTLLERNLGSWVTFVGL